MTITLALCAALGACSSSSTPFATDIDGGETDAGGAADTGTTPADASAAADAAPAKDGGATDGGGCGSVSNDAPPVAATATLTAMPTAGGGTIRPGRYHLTAWAFYGVASPPPGTIKTTMVVTATTMEYVADAGPGASGSVAVTYTTTGTAISQVQTCRLPALAQLPDGTTTPGTYEATATQLAIFSAENGGISSVQTFVKQ